MERYRQQFPKLIMIEDWLAKAHPDVSALPWMSDDGREICSFAAIVPREETFSILVVLFDAHGREAARSGDVLAIQATATALSAAPGDLMFLPVPIKMKQPIE
jgi:hypothetical protein